MASGEEIGRILRAGAARSGLSLSSGQSALLERYLDLVSRWSGRLRLTGTLTRPDRARVLVVDAMAVLPFLPSHGLIIDLGSGAGVPGIPVGICRPALHVVLTESSEKKAAFLQLAIRELALTNAEVLHARAETLGRASAHREHYEAVTARAVAKLRVLLEYAVPLLKVGGVAVLPKGHRAAEEIKAAARALSLLGGEATLRAAPASSAVVVVRKIAPTPPAYPRRPGIPSRRPL